jgi:hypothetical protein
MAHASNGDGNSSRSRCHGKSCRCCRGRPRMSHGSNHHSNHCRPNCDYTRNPGIPTLRSLTTATDDERHRWGVGRRVIDRGGSNIDGGGRVQAQAAHKPRRPNQVEEPRLEVRPPGHRRSRKRHTPSGDDSLRGTAQWAGHQAGELAWEWTSESPRGAASWATLS